MAVAKEYPLVIAFCAIMFCDKKLREEALESLKKELGKIAKITEEINFSKNTDYYENEMGDDIKKIYIVFDNPIKREFLSQLKLKTNEIERNFTKNGRRQINIDPGYITEDKFVLASAKDYFHRIAIGNGIFAETTIHFSANDKIRRFSWTYKDYLTPQVRELLIFGRYLANKI
ncbi:MAG: DUF4416 family protein [Chitinispirillales bacterium]|jgi:hypothetical protein|nr:DUF4416 family protein [Chitinispirillales bacterium]